MSTLTRIIVTGIIGILMLSCNFSLGFGEGVDGNRNVVSVDREIPLEFSEIKISQGLELDITQSSDVALTVEADENLHDLIVTKVENNVLEIYSTENIRRAAAKHIYLSAPNISFIKASSGSNIESTNTIKSNTLGVSGSSGASITLSLDVNETNCNTSSGSSISLIGSTKTFNADASSGSSINAKKLVAESTDAKASSGANVSTNTTSALTANASSGGSIRYSGNPKTVNASDSSAGSVRKQ